MKKLTYIAFSLFLFNAFGQSERPTFNQVQNDAYLSYDELEKLTLNNEGAYLWNNEGFAHQDQSAEIIGRRSKGSKTFSTANPTHFILHAASGKVHYEENGTLKTLYHSFLPKNNQFVAEHNSFKTYLPVNLNDGASTMLSNGQKLTELLDLELVFFDESGNEISSIFANNSVGKVIQNEIIYSGAYGNDIAIQVQHLSNSKKLDYILNEGFLNQIPANTEFIGFREVVLIPEGFTVDYNQEENISVEDLNEKINSIEQKIKKLETINEKSEGAKVDNIQKAKIKLVEMLELRDRLISDEKTGLNRNVQSMTILDSDGEFAFNFPFPTLTDQSEDNAELDRTKSSFYNVIKNGNELIIDVMVNVNWLKSADRVFPVYVDPTTEYTPSNTTWWTGRVYADGDRFDDDLRIGDWSDGLDIEGWAKFDISALSSGDIVTSISLDLTSNGEYSSFNDGAINITELTNEPVAATGQTIYDDILGNTHYLENQNPTDAGGSGSWSNNAHKIFSPLGSSANTTMQSQINSSSGWFGIGVEPYVRTWDYDYVKFYGHNDGAKKPHIDVTYVQVPVVSTSVASYTSGTSATGGGNCTSDGGSSVTEKGVCWSSTNSTPTISDSKAADGTSSTGTGTYSNTTMSPLGFSSVIYYRAYATNANGTGYGDVLTFTTETPAGAPLPTGFYISGTVTNNGTIVSTNDQNWMRMTGTSNEFTGNGSYTDTRLFADGTTDINPSSSLTFTQTYINASKSIDVLSGKTMNNGSLVNKGTLTLSGTGAINNSDYWNNSGTVTAATTSLVTFSASSDQNVTSGGSAFGKVTLNNSSSGTYEGIVLQDAMTVNGALTFTDGNIQLGTYDLTLGSSSSISGTTGTGTMVITASSGVMKKNTVSNFTFPVGTSKSSYTPVKVNNTGTADTYSVYVTDNVLVSGTSGDTYNIGRVAKTWHVDEASAGGSNVTITPYWSSGDEDSQFLNSECGVSHYTSSAWDDPGVYIGATSSGGMYSISRGSITSFSPFMVRRSDFTPLPITLSYFGGTCNEDGNEIVWVTSSESNSSHFTLKRSFDGEKWEDIGNKQGAGNSSTDIEYKVKDIQGSRSPLSYYRLHQYDFNNDSSTFGPISVECSNIETRTNGSLTPNPAIEASYLTIENCPLGDATITLMSSTGEVIYTERLVVTKPNDAYFIDALDLARGAYIIRFVAPNNEVITMKLVKN